MRGTPYLGRMEMGLRRPKVTQLGVDFAGTVEAVGKNVTQFKPGDDVFGGRTGAFADYVAVRADRNVVLKPANVTFEQAAAIPVAASTALQAVRDQGAVRAGQKVLVNGASGGVGTFAVQIAKWLGADVTGVCSTRNADMVHSIGADHVIDYTKVDFATGGERYDLIMAANGKRTIWDYRRALTADGAYVMTGGSNRQLTHALLFGPLLSLRRQQFGNLLVKTTQADLLTLKALCETGKIRPVIDRRFALTDVASAVRYVEDGHARGKVVVTM
jgi:NADPH:quinone reductase-like Zn-dependent oxidoreductase